jgi:cation diffusion facilitator family transporter
MTIERRKSAAAWVSVGSNITLVVAKLLVGLLIGSVSILSEAIHSGVDLLAAIIALVAVKTSSRPADDAHPFGHGKAENISGTVEALLIFFAAAWIIYEAARKFLHPGVIEAGKWGWGAALMFLSAGVNIVVSRMLFRVGRVTHSVALEADAWHLRTDVWTSAGVMAALSAIWLGEAFFPSVNLDWLDPVAAIFVATLILRAAWDLTMKAGRDLMDEKLPAEEEAWIRDLIRGLAPTVLGFHRLRTRKAGPNRFIEFHAFVDGSMSVERAHELSHDVARKVEGHFPGSQVTIHIEPCRGNCSHSCREGCFLDQASRDTVRAKRPDAAPTA